MTITDAEIAALKDAVAEMIRQHAIANAEWGPLGYDGIADDVLKAISAPLLARLERAEGANAKLREALEGVDVFFSRPGESSTDAFERVALAFYKSTGYLRPGKDCRLHDFETRQAAWDVWVAARLAASRAALGDTP